MFRHYDSSYFARIALIEQEHFWFRSRANVIARIARQVTAPFAPGYRVLDIGCGTGNALAYLREACERGSVIGMDLHAEGLRHARLRVDCALVQADVLNCPFSVQFQLICAFDVLEHLDEDEQVLRSLRDMLAPAGAILLTVPAHPFLWSYFDEASCHTRRYKPRELSSKLERAGYQIEYLTQYMSIILPFVWVRRKAPWVQCGTGIRDMETAHRLADRDMRIVPVVNEGLVWLASAEAAWIGRRHTLPFGASLLAIARR